MTHRRNAILLMSITLAILALGLVQSPTASGHRMYRFGSYEEVQRFVADNSLYCSGGLVPGTRTDGQVLSLANSNAGALSSTPTHSETNNQVQGVDELDTVKTDGNYIYTVNGSKVVIVKAYPALDAGVASVVSVNGTVIGVFVNGDKLAIFGQPTQSYVEPYLGLGMAFSTRPYWGSSETSVWVYDIHDRARPELRTTISVEGSYIGSRMIGDFVYLIASQSIPYCVQDFQLPTQLVNQRLTVMPVQQIYHSDLADYGHTFTNVLGFDIIMDGEGSSFESFMLGTSGTIYVSSQDLYLTSPIYNGEEATVIHRIVLDRDTIRYEATGQVPGTILNQFSMDEYGGYFHVATHSWSAPTVRALTINGSQPGAVTSTTTPEYTGPSSGVYVLTKDLAVIGRLEGLGQGENFHSARFIGDRAYLVTFKKTDPLFVIDLGDAASPKLLGELIVAGYSDYLQPYDENHLIGIGKDADDQGSFAWYLGVKVALFDVTDPGNPLELGKYVIGDRGTESPALYEHKAVLFDHDRNLLVIPVELAKLRPDAYVGERGTPVWQGAYVFTISPENGVVFRGGISHLGDEVPDYTNQYRWVNRSLFIEDVLYTISQKMIKMNSLADLQEINTVTF